MGTEAPAASGDQKPAIKNEEGNPAGRPNNGQNNRRDNRNNHPFPKKEKFQGAHPDLKGFVFVTGPTRSIQIHNFTKTDERIKAHVGQNFDPLVLQSLEEVKVILPVEPTAVTQSDGSMTKLEELKYGKQYDKWLVKTDTVKNQMKQVYAIYFNQCDDDMKATLAEDPTYSTVNKTKDLIGLYKILQSVNFSYTNSEDPLAVMWRAKRDFVMIRQGKGQSVSDYYERFLALKDVCETLDVNIYEDLGLAAIIAREQGKDLTTMAPADADAFKTDAMIEGADRLMAIHFIMGADPEIYGGLLRDLRHNWLMTKKSDYPTNLQGAYTLLKGWSKGRPPNGRQLLGVAFNTNGDEDGDTLVNDGAKYKGPPCGRCGRKNHPTDECYAKKHADGTVLHIEGDGAETEVSDHLTGSIGSNVHGLMFLNSDLNSSTTKPNTSSKTIPNTWILLDSQSTIDVFSNGELLTNIHPITTTMHIKCNAGSKSTNLRGHLSGYGWVWYFPSGIANILSLSRVKEKFRVTYDSAADNSFHVHKEGKVLKFREAARRLFYFDTAERDEVATMLVTTVDDNLSKFSAYDVNKAKLARSIQKRIGRPSTQDFVRYVRNNLIPNCPITVGDIQTAETIWGPDLGSLKGKTVRHKSPAVRVVSHSIPLGIMQKYKDVTLSTDVMKVNGIPFLMTISKHIKFGSAGKLDDMKTGTMLCHFKTVFNVYAIRGFRVTIVLADNQFESMRGDLADLGAIINVVSRDEHVPEIERYNRTIKDRVRSAYNVLPFTHVPPVLIVELVYSQVFWRNMFALKGGISKTQSPAELILNRKLDFNAHCKVEFGEYVQTHEEHDNSMQTRTVGAIATRPTGNDQGGYYFIRLDTGRRINRKDWTPLPMPSEVVDQVHRLARRAKSNPTLTFTNIHNEDLDELYANILGIDDDETYPVPDGFAGVGDATDDDDESNDDESNDSDYVPSDSDSSNSESDTDDEPDEETDEQLENEQENEDVPMEIPGVDEPVDTPGVDTDTTGVDMGEPVDTPGVDMDEPAEIPGVDEDDSDDQTDERTYGGMSLRPQPRREYNVFNVNGEEEREEIVMLQFNDEGGIEELDRVEAEYTFLTETLGWGKGMNNNEPGADMLNEKCLDEYLLVTEQMGWKKGLKIFQEKGEEAIQNELQQIHDMEGFQPRHWHELTEQERARALRYLMYLKEKRDGRIKGRGCADGRPQRLYTEKAESSSPTASLAGMIMTCVIDAYEGRDVATVDIPGAFLQTKMPEDEEPVHVVLDGRMAELLAKISPETYQEYVAHKRGQAFIYCKLNVALYGTLKAALLFWEKLTKSLKKRGFVINPYDWCIANMDINGKQCTIVWHVDDLKISHVDSTVVDEIIASLKEEYGKIGTMTVRRGKVHDYLGMELDFSTPKNFIINMEPYLDELFESLKDIEDMQGTASTPAAEHLFKTRDNVDKLDKETAELFHTVTAKLLWATKRGRPDVHTAIAFLCTRVKSPDQDDYKKLVRVIKYLRRTKFLRLRMSATHLDQNHWLIDGAFAVHNDMRSHSGSFMTFGRGMMNGSSNKQRINTTSSTEAEVVAVHDNMPSILWTRYFLEEQGYPMKPSIIHQDNQSAMLLETNGRGSSSKRTRHMNIRYFFVADCQKRNQVIITYCPTDEMIGDFFTKPLNGAKFRRFRNIIMNCDVDEYGPVDVDELMAAHFKRVDQIIEKNDVSNKRVVHKNLESEPKIKSSELIKIVGSQECVGKLTNSQWAVRRKARKNNNKSGPRPLINSQSKLMGSNKIRGATRTTNHRTWAQVVSE